MSAPLLTETHVSRYRAECWEIYHPDTGARTIDDFVHLVDRLSKKHVVEDNHDAANTFKGDMLEVFSEIFFGEFTSDPMVGVRDYKPVPLSEDYGVDATGINVVGEAVVVQCKFRSNPSEAITYEDMAKTYTAGRKRHGISLEKEDTVFLFTTCNNVTRPCEEVFGRQLRLVGRSVISYRLGNDNETFWVNAEQRIAFTFQKLGLL